jgi:hypothetical protein
MLCIAVAFWVAAACVSAGIVDISDDMTTTVGTPVSLQCITSNQDPVNWDFRGLTQDSMTLHVVYEGELTYDYQPKTRYSASSDQGTHNLTINGVQLEDSGTFICIENGGLGPARSSVTLTVTEKVAVMVKSTRPSSTAVTDQEGVTSETLTVATTAYTVEQTKFLDDSTSAASTLPVQLDGPGPQCTAVENSASSLIDISCRVSCVTCIPADDQPCLHNLPVVGRHAFSSTMSERGVVTHQLSVTLNSTYDQLSALADTCQLRGVFTVLTWPQRNTGNAPNDGADIYGATAKSGDQRARQFYAKLHYANTAGPTAGHLAGQCMTLLVSACVSLLFN